jgi:hypothetical protein
METPAAYLARKNAELAWLNRKLRTPLPQQRAEDPEAVVEQKFALRARLMAEAVEHFRYLTETNSLDDDVQTVPPFDLDYRYQRFDMVVRAPAIYPAERADHPLIRAVQYASSGMGAITSLLLALDKAPVASNHVVARRDVYFETQHVLRDLTTLDYVAVDPEDDLPAAARAQEGHVTVLVDSISARDDCGLFERLEPGTVDLLLFDSTCYEVGSERIERAVEAAVRLDTPLVLLRSHVKIDFLGVEYGRLGSAVFLVTPMCARETLTLFRALQQVCQRVMRLTGAAAVPTHLNPFLADPEFRAHNRARLARIVENNLRATERVAAALADTPIHVSRYHHGLFFTLGLLPESDAAMADVIGLIRDLVCALRAQGLPLRYANSFGFDFAAVTHYRDARRLEGIRVALPDHPTELVDRVCEALLQWCRQRVLEG